MPFTTTKPVGQFTDINGKPLDGQVFFGQPNLDPIASPITVYWDAAGTQPVTQPVVTVGGYPMNGSTRSNVFVNADYSILVRNRNGFTVFSAPNLPFEDSSDNQYFLQAGSGAVQRTVQSKLRDVVSVLDFGADPTGGTDSTQAIQNAFDALQENQTLVFSGLFKTNGVVTISTSRIGVNFDGARFYVGDTGTPATTVSGAVGIVGYHFKQVTKVQITGSAEFIGLGTSGVTSLLGVYFDTCSDISCPAFMRFETMAIGRGMRDCVRSDFGNAIGNDMNGLQTFESPPTNNAGSVEVITGCSYGQFGDVVAYNNEKPARYLSVGTGASDNIACTFGNTICDGVDVSPTTALALQIRSAVDCSFGSVVGNGLTVAVAIQQYNTDAAWAINRVFIASVSGPFPSTAASVDAVLDMSTTSPNPIGSVTIGSIDANCSGEHGIFVTSGNLTINSAKLQGSAGRLITTSNASGTGDVTVSIGTLTINGHTSGNETIRIGKGSTLHIDHINVTQGVSTTGVPLVRYFASVGTGSFNGVLINSLRNSQGSASNNYNYFFYDDSGANPFTAWYIGNVYGNAVAAHLYCDNRDFWIRRGNYFSANFTLLAAAYQVGDILWDSNAAAGAPPGWYCVTAGSPGTWKAMANLAV